MHYAKLFGHTLKLLPCHRKSVLDFSVDHHLYISQQLGEIREVTLLAVVECWGTQFKVIKVYNNSLAFGLSIYNAVGSIRQSFKNLIWSWSWMVKLLRLASRYNWAKLHGSPTWNGLPCIFWSCNSFCLWNVAIILFHAWDHRLLEIWGINTWWTGNDWATFKHNVDWELGLSAKHKLKQVYPVVGCTLLLYAKQTVLIWWF